MSETDTPNITYEDGNGNLKAKLLPSTSEFSHPIPLKIVMYARSKPEGIIGVRELANELEVKSVSTVVWHLDKLQDAGYLEKTPSNKYQLTEKGKTMNSLELKINYPVWYFKGTLLPAQSLVLGFLITAVILYGYLFFSANNPITVQVYGFVILLFVLAINLGQWIMFKRRINQFLE